MAVLFTGCGARSLLENPPGATGGAPSTGGGGADAGADADAGDDAADAAPDVDVGDAMIAPVPTCSGQNSECVLQDGGLTWLGATVIQCDPVYFVGPWNLLLERKILNQFLVIQTQQVPEPGFGAKFFDYTGPPAQLTYKVCVSRGAQGVVCGAEFTTAGPVNCACEPLTCDFYAACNTTLDDGCGNKVQCGPCMNNVACNPENNSCCPPGQFAEGDGKCVCAPPFNCAGAWNVNDCACEQGEG